MVGESRHYWRKGENRQPGCPECGCSCWGVVQEYGAWIPKRGSVTVTVWKCILCGREEKELSYDA